MTTIGKAWPALGEGDTLLAAALSVAGVWTAPSPVSWG
jgi:hypothetical protein